MDQPASRLVPLLDRVRLNNRTREDLARSLCLAALVLGARAVQGQTTGSIVGWGEHVVVEPEALEDLAAVAGGEFHSLGLQSDGSIVAWGMNWYGQCNVPAPNTEFVAAAAGYEYSLGLKADGSIVAWGRNDNGQCNTPVPNAGFVAVATGAEHSLGLKADGSIIAWGSNDFGQCDVPAPNTDFVAVAAGAWHSLGLRADGSIVAWGANWFGQCNMPAPNTGFVAVAGGGAHSLGLRADSIVAWGGNWLGQCNVPAPNTGFVAVAAGYAHNLGLKADGSIIAWGLNDSSQCNVPAPNTGFVVVAAGYAHSLGLKADGSITTWGLNEDGQCSLPAPNTGFAAVAAGYDHSLGLKADGSIIAWGSNDYGQCDVPAPNADFAAVAGGWGHSLGLKADGSIVAWGYNEDRQCYVPAPNADFVAVAGGGGHSLGLKADGSIVVWGRNADGQHNIPEPNEDFVALAAGGGHSLGLKSDGTIVAWGSNDQGQSSVPVPDADFVAVAAGYDHSLGLKADGSIVAWGYNYLGQCDVPAPNAGFVAVAGGSLFSLGLRGSFIFGLHLTGPPVRIGGAGEVVSFSAEARNYGPADDTYNVNIAGVPAGWSYSYTTPAGTFSGPSTLPLASGNTAPITISIDSEGNPGTVTARLCLVSQGDPRQFRSASFTKLNGAQVLVVDDDGGESREIPVLTTLRAIGSSYGVYDATWGALTLEDLLNAGESVVWLTGATSLSLDAGERALISSYLAGGGRMLLSGQEIAYDLADPSSPYFSGETILWFINTLHCLYVGGSAGVYALTGVAGDPLGAGLSFMIEDEGPYVQVSPDVLGQLSGVNFLTYNGMPTWFGGMHFTDGNQHLVYLSFGLEGIAELYQQQRELLLSRVLEWFGVSAGVSPGEASPASAALAPIAPNPVRPPTTIEYRLAAAGPVRLRIYDVGGRLVRTLVDEQEPAAEHRQAWNGCDESGRPVPSGVYFYRLEAGGQSATQRLVVVR